MRIKSICAKNFKGFGDEIFSFDGKDAIIKGDNGSGKTTVADAWSWLLSGKNSSGRADFSLKPLDEDGQERHGADVFVEAVVDIDGEEKTLAKTYKEDWRKVKGSSGKKLSGHTTEYFLFKGPVKKKEWDAFIESIAPAKVLAASSPTSLLSLHWQKLRELVIGMAGEADADAIVDSDHELADLPAMLDGKPIDDAIKIAKQRRKDTNKALDEISPRIDELKKAMEDAPRRTVKQIEAEIKQIGKEINQKNAGADIGEKRKRLAELEADLAEAGGKARQKAILDAEKTEQDRAALVHAAHYERLKASDAEADAKRLGETIQKYESGLETIREKWRAINAEEFTAGETCPTCGQGMPEDKLESARAAFNQEKAYRLAEINDAGKSQRAEVERLKASVDELMKAAERHKKEAEGLESDAEKITAQGAPEKSDAEKKLEAEISKLKAEIAAAPSTDTSALEAALRDAHGRLAAVKAADSAKARIEELASEEKRLAGELVTSEKLMSLAEKFELAKALAMEEKANALFSNVKWKLFDVQLNGGINPTCVATVDGVPAGYGLNRGAEIGAGIEIADKVMSHYGVSLPIFVDNSESATVIPKTKAQKIELRVVEKEPSEEMVDLRQQISEWFKSIGDGVDDDDYDENEYGEEDAELLALYKKLEAATEANKAKPGELQIELFY